ncbi:MAG: hypothetical protein ACKV0T_05505 [Planctomycetales bacterium]
MSNRQEKCPFCKVPVVVNKSHRDDHNIHASVYEYSCERCGPFVLTNFLYEQIGDNAKITDSFLISGYIREQLAPPFFRAYEELDNLLSGLPRSIPDRGMKLLKAIARQSNFFGDVVELNEETDFPLAYAKNNSELCSFIKYLIELGLIIEPDFALDEGRGFSVTAHGFDVLTKARTANLESSKVFVAMWFSPELTPVYESEIKSGIEDAGFNAIRIDFEEFNDDVVARILSEIRESRFLVADFTGQRNGVYLETGFAMGLGIPVVWLCRKDEIDKAHFDTNHFNHLTWSPDGNLRARLANRIKATIGVGPLGPN